MGQLVEWKKIKHGYEVSNNGRLRSYRNNNGKIKKEPHAMKKFLAHNGYYRVTYCGRLVMFHRLVALAFIGLRPDGYQVNHINGIKTDNRPCNLEYVTSSYNNSHKYLSGLDCNKGERHSQNKLNEKQVYEILKSKDKQKDLAKKYNVSTGLISVIKSRKAWGHLSV